MDKFDSSGTTTQNWHKNLLKFTRISFQILIENFDFFREGFPLVDKIG